MCGIVGAISLKHSHQIRLSQFQNMVDCLSHRGPDDSGLYLNKDKTVGLGFRRLSIIDLSEKGHQPMYDAAKRAVIIFNGEVYNYIELRKELLGKGYKFNSKTDSEVLLNAYLEWGTECLHRISGMYAFAIWDEQRESLFIARDPFGIKPLYYTLQNDFFAFASELKSLQRIQELPLPINIHAIWNYLTLLQVPAPESIYSTIQKLLPGHAIQIRRGVFQRWRYWTPEFEELNCSEDEMADQVLSLLRKAVQSHLVADVPVGVFLSGGIDSSALVALASSSLQAPVKTFSARFSSNPELDEGKYQKIIVDRFHTEHEEFEVQPDILAAGKLLLEESDEPFAVSSAIPLYYISKMASEHVKVVLSGDGGDELFGGYVARYRKARLTRHLSLLPHAFRKPLRRFGDSLYHSHGNNLLFRRIHRVLSLAEYDEPERYLYSFGFFDRFEKARIFRPEYIDGIRCDFGDHYQEIFPQAPDEHLQKYFYMDFMTALADEMLTKTDRCTSMVSIEGRVPFLDKELVTFAMKIPQQYKFSGGNGKKILKKALRNVLPDKILSAKKGGFNVPLDSMISAKSIDIRRRLVHEPEDEFGRMLNIKEVDRFIGLHTNHDPHYGHHIWALMQLNDWFAMAKQRSQLMISETLFQ